MTQVERAVATTEASSIRPFEYHATEEQLADLRRRIAAMKWPEQELVPDASQGVQLATMQKLASYWSTDYDWRKVEAKLNSIPQFITEIDGLDIHFIHVRSKHDDALPLIVTHGWPGSIIEQLKIIDPLTNPTAYGGSGSDAFHLVIPSIPGFGFSGKPTTTGWDPARTARAWATLMKRLGYDRFVAQGGDWGGMITDVMGTQAPPELLGIHLNWTFSVPQTSIRRFKAGARCRMICQSTKSAPANSWTFSTSMEWATRSRWRADRRPFTRSRIRPSVWRRGFLTTTHAVTK
jgi:pimeloyl-ACP methyl ester carboxylesterase